jgi:hypothetical protein
MYPFLQAHKQMINTTVLWGVLKQLLDFHLTNLLSVIVKTIIKFVTNNSRITVSYVPVFNIYNEFILL